MTTLAITAALVVAYLLPGQRWTRSVIRRLVVWRRLRRAGVRAVSVSERTAR